MLFFLGILLSIGFLSAYMLIEFFEYLKKFHSLKWKELSFERPFGISQEDFYFHPVRPLRFLPFLFSRNDINDRKITIYKTMLKLSLLQLHFCFLFTCLTDCYFMKIPSIRRSICYIKHHRFLSYQL